MTKNSPLEKPQALGRNAPSVATRANPTATSMREGSQGLLRRSAVCMAMERRTALYQRRDSTVAGRAVSLLNDISLSHACEQSVG